MAEERERDREILCCGFARANNRVNKEREASAVLSCGFHFRISSFHHTHHRRIACTKAAMHSETLQKRFVESRNL